MRQLILVVLVLAVAWCALLAGLTALAVLATRRLVLLMRGAVRSRGRQLSEAARLRIGAYGGGNQARAARLRFELRDAVADTRRTVDAAANAGWPVGDSPSLVHRLERVAVNLDTQLRLIALDHRAAGDEQQLDELRDRVGTVIAACADLRHGMRAQGCWVDDEELVRLREDCRIESQALDSQRIMPGYSQAWYDQAG